jgi:UDP-glucose 4-epimerase
MDLFITGANSFVGLKLQESCRELGIDYRGIDMVGPFSSTIRELDLRSDAIVDHIPRASVVVHLAAVSRDSDCDAEPSRAMSINVGGTVNLANSAIRAGAKRIVFASSEWVYGRSPSEAPLTEAMGPAWPDLKSLYAFSKATGEEVLLALAHQLPVSILRFGIIYGPRMSNWSAFEYVVNAAFSGTVAVGSAATSRRFIHVEDVCMGVLEAAGDGSSSSHIWNLSGPALVTLGDVAEAAERVLGRAVTVVESAPMEPSIRNPIADLIQLETKWAPKWDTLAGVTEVSTFVAESGKMDMRS